jgi:hypothetical protein
MARLCLQFFPHHHYGFDVITTKLFGPCAEVPRQIEREKDGNNLATVSPSEMVIDEQNSVYYAALSIIAMYNNIARQGHTGGA